MKKKMMLSVLLFSVMMIFSINALAADWYTATVAQVVTRVETGETILQIIPLNTASGFEVKSRLNMLNTDVGANKTLALILTAVSLGKPINVYTASMPTWTTQKLLSASVIIE